MNDIFKLNCEVSKAEISAGKAFIILCDLFETYSFEGVYPSEEQAKIIGREAGKIMSFIEIAMDYIYQTQEDIRHAVEDLRKM